MESQHIEPFDYMVKLKDHLQSRKKTWKWFHDKEIKEKQISEFKTSLLKNSYRMDRENSPKLYAHADQACALLGISAKVHFYQLMNVTGLNASISSVGDEAHIAITGPLLTILDDSEMLSVIGHELSHFLIDRIEDEAYETAGRCINALANDPQSRDEHIESARVFNLYKELFCDMGAYHVVGSMEPVVSSLVKLSTRQEHIHVSSYIDQALELVSENEADDSTTHPRNHIRALSLYYLDQKEKDRQKKIEKLIQSKLDINSLDIFRQQRLEKITERLMQCIVYPRWIQTDEMLALSKQYFPDFIQKKEDADLSSLRIDIENCASSVKRYLSYVLLDFALADSSLESAPIAYALEISELIDVKKQFVDSLRKELKLTVKEFKELEQKAMSELSGLSDGAGDGLYTE